MKAEKTFFLKMFGCKVNQYESQVIRENLEKSGFHETSKANPDFIIINSCTVTGQADIKTRKLIRKMKKENPDSKILVTGCYAVIDEDISLLAGMPEVYRVIPNKEKLKLSAILDEEGLGHEDIPPRITDFSSHTRAFVKIQDGCDQNCAYCKVTLVRGPSWSRNKEEIKNEIGRLLGGGYKEIVLTGICVGLWRGDKGEKLHDLLREIIGFKDEFRLRLSSIEPNHIDEELINVVRESGSVCKHFHIPLQSGSDRILKMMNRKYNTEKFSEIINNIRSKIPFAGITMDVIVGFPGETENDFKLTEEYIKKIRPSRLHVFPYSERKGTLAQRMDKKVSKEIIDERVGRVIEIGKGLQLEFCKKNIDREINVLIEGNNQNQKSKFSGYTSEYVKVKINGIEDRVGEIVNLKASSLDEDSFSLVASEKNLIKKT